MTFPVLTTKGFLIYPTITAAMQERTMFIVHKNHTIVSLVPMLFPQKRGRREPRDEANDGVIPPSPVPLDLAFASSLDTKPSTLHQVTLAKLKSTEVISSQGCSITVNMYKSITVLIEF